MDHSSSIDESPSPLIHKRKRSKRYHALAPPSTVAAASSASSNITEEVLDLANCLMLLSQGRHSVPIKQAANLLFKPTEFECKTCTKSFPSFQALGGHRSSHKKLKVTNSSETNLIGSTVKPIDFSSGVAGGRQRTHTCSICKAEFSSGQALGGHMRRHRPSLLSERNLEITIKENKVFSIDPTSCFADDESGDDVGAGGLTRKAAPAEGSSLHTSYPPPTPGLCYKLMQN